MGSLGLHIAPNDVSASANGVVTFSSAKTAAAWFADGFYLDVAGRVREAIVAYRYALEMDPFHTSAWHNLSLVFARVQRFAECERCLNEILRLDEHHFRAMLTYGNVKFFEGDLKAAQVWYERALAIAPNYQKALSNCALVCELSGQCAKSHALRCRLLHLDPHEPISLAADATCAGVLIARSHREGAA